MPGTRRWTPSQFDDLRRRLRIAAAGIVKARNVFGLRSQGAPMLGADVEDLIGHALLCLIEGKPPIDLLVETEFDYCRTRMLYKIRTICDRDENQPKITKFFPVASTDVVDTEDVNTLAIIVDPGPLPDIVFMSAETMQRFCNILAQERPHLVQLFQLQSIYDTDVATEARTLNLSFKEIYRLRRELKAARERFSALYYKSFGG
jgi:hypothetical protein